MTPKQFEQLIKTNAKQLAKAFERTIPVKVGVAAEQHFKDNFRKGGFVNGGLKAWKPAKRQSDPKNPDRAYKTLMSRRNNLYSSIRHSVKPYTAVVSTDVPYAQAHNEGANNAGRGHRTRIPKRQFMGESRELTNKVQRLVVAEINKILKP